MKKTILAAMLFFSTLLCFAQYNENWLYVGARFGGSLNLYTAEGAYRDIGASFDSSFGLYGAVQAAVQINEFIAVQTELVYTNDKAVTNNSGIEEKFESNSLLIPILAKITHNSGKFYVAGLAGIYFTVPAGEMTKTASGSGVTLSGFSSTPPMGIMFGVSVGYKLGPGILFADLRWADDFSKTSYNNRGNPIGLYSREKMPITIGYEIGLIRKKKK